jgi:hypothetical protein
MRCEYCLVGRHGLCLGAPRCAACWCHDPAPRLGTFVSTLAALSEPSRDTRRGRWA